MSYETEEIVTTEESGIIASSPSGKLLIADEDDSILQNDNNDDSLPTEGDSNSEANEINDIEQYQNEGNSDILDNTIMKPPHKKRSHHVSNHVSIDSSTLTSFPSATEKDAIKGGIKSCDQCSYTSISTVRLRKIKIILSLLASY